MENTTRPPEVFLYGRSMKEEGYVKGYNQCVYDYRKLRAKREKRLQILFGLMWDRIDDLIAKNKKP